MKKHRASYTSKVAKADAIRRMAGIVRAARMSAQYSSLRGGTLRKEPEIRMEGSETEQVFSGIRRLRAYAQANELYENDPIGSTLDTCIRLTIGTKGGNPTFHGAGAEQYQVAFRSWKRSCGFAEGESWQEMLQLILRAVKLHGDCIVVCDPRITDGRVRIWDADQCTNVEDADFASWKAENGADGARQIEGAVVTPDGRVLGWFVTGLRNRVTVPLADAFFVSARLGRRVSYRKRITQYRGEPSVLPNMEISNDTRELLKSEVAAAKLASEMAIVAEQPEAIGGELAGILDGQPMDELTSGTGLTDDDVAALTSAATDGATFKAFDGRAAIAYVPPGTKVNNLAAVRPSAPVQSWTDLLADSNGRQLGVMSCLSRGRADNSYSSGQIELSISWAAFEEDQKLLERQVVDYVIASLWPEAEYDVSWPKAFEIDPEKTEKVLDLRLRGGRTTYREILGSDWRAKLAQLAEEQAELKRLGLTNMSLFTTASGAVIEEAQKDE